MHGLSVPTVLAIPGVIDTECFISAGVKDTNIRPMSCSVPVVQLDSLEEFHSTVYPTRRPTILRGVSLGPAPSEKLQATFPHCMAWRVGVISECRHQLSQQCLTSSILLPSSLLSWLSSDSTKAASPQDTQSYLQEVYYKPSPVYRQHHDITSISIQEEKYYLRSIGNNPRKVQCT